MEKRTLVALALSFLVLGTYPLLLQKMYPDYYRRLEQEKKSRAAAPAQASTSAAAAPAAASPAVTAPVTGVQAALDRQADREFSTDKLQLVYNQVDGSIRAAAFKAFAHKDGKPFEFFSRQTAGAGPGGVLFLNADDSYPRALSMRTEGPRVDASGSSSDGRFRFTQTAEWSGYSAKVRITVENATDSDQKLLYAYGLGETIPARNSIDGQYLESNFFERRPEGEKKLVHVKETKAGKVVSSSAPVDWVSVKDRHFAIIAKPAGEDSWTGRVRGLGDHRAQTMLVSPEIVLAPRGRLEHELTLFIGPVDLQTLSPLRLESIISFGKLDGIGRLLVGALELMHKIARNWGLAIILLTVGINLLLFPLTRASFLSMKRMQDLQPQMTRLREQYKNQPEKMHKEMMDLYKKHKVNPFGGCLPMLLQMPVFIALYVALSKSVILINAPFFWIDDLSTPDRVPLPFSLPFIGSEIHLLPLIMAAGMAVQQKFTQMPAAAQDPAIAQQQKMMAVLMPIIFCFIFYTMPSGLVLYWLTNTVLMTSYQAFLKRSAPSAA